MRGTRFGHGGVALVLWCLLALLPLEASWAQGQSSDAPSSRRRRTLEVGISRGFPPWEFVNDAGEPDGFNVDVVKAVARVMGLQLRIRAGGWAEQRAAFDQGQLDLLAGMSFSPARAERVALSEPYNTMHYSLFTREDYSHRGRHLLPRPTGFDPDHRIIVVSGSRMHEEMVARGYEPNLVLVDSEPTALRLLAAGRHDCALLTQLHGLLLIRRLELNNIQQRRSAIHQTKICIAVARDNPQLLDQINQGLAILHATGQYQQIYDKWFGMVDPAHSQAATLVRYAAIVAALLALLLCASMLWTWSLRKQVLQRTAELRRNEHEIQVLLDTIPHGVERVDGEGHIVYANKALHRMLGYADGELVGLPVWTFQEREEDRQMLKELHRDLLKKRPPPMTLTARNRTRDGRTVDVQVDWDYLRDGQNEPVGFVSIITDITQRKLAEEQSRLHMEQIAHISRVSTMGEMAAGLAHEINQPLAAITNYAGACLADLSSKPGGTGGDPRIAESLGEIVAQAERAGQIIRHLRAFVAKEPMRFHDADPAVIARHAADLVQSEVRRIRARLDVVLVDPLPRVLVDQIQIEQVLINLIRNGLEAIEQCPTPPMSRRVELRVESLGEFVRFTVTDSGAGIDKRVLGRVFDAFYTTKPDGMGLGLSISRTIAESHGGRLWFEPPEPPAPPEVSAVAGTRCCLELPRQGNGHHGAADGS